MIAAGAEHVLDEAQYRAVCIDLTSAGHGDVEGDGPVSFYMARESGNHFTPLLATDESGVDLGLEQRDLYLLALQLQFSSC